MQKEKESHWEKAKREFAHLAENWDEAKKNSRGKPKAFKNPHALWCAACDYFKESDAKPLMKYEVVKAGKQIGRIIGTPVVRPYSWTAFQAWLWQNKIIRQLNFYKANKGGEYDEFQEVIGAIDDIMFSQKFEYASIGVFKENIIIRDLQIRDERNKEDGEDFAQIAPTINVYTGAPPLSNSESEVSLNKSITKSNENENNNQNSNLT